MGRSCAVVVMVSPTASANSHVRLSLLVISMVTFFVLATIAPPTISPTPMTMILKTMPTTSLIVGRLSSVNLYGHTLVISDKAYKGFYTEIRRKYYATIYNKHKNTKTNILFQNTKVYKSISLPVYEILRFVLYLFSLLIYC